MKSLYDFLFLLLDSPILYKRLRRGIENQKTGIAIDEDIIAELDMLTDSLHTNDRRNFQGTRHDGRVGGLASNLGHKPTHEIAIQLRGIGRSQVMSNDNVLMVVGCRIMRSFAQEIANHPTRHILNIHDTFAQIRIIDSLERGTIFLSDLLKNIVHVQSLTLQHAKHFIDECAIFHNKKMSIKNTGILRTDCGDNALLDFQQLHAGGYERSLKTNDFALHIGVINRMRKNFLIDLVTQKSGEVRNTLCNRNAAKTPLLFLCL